MISDQADASLTHVLLTRFNLATPGRELPIRLKPGWLEHRFHLFERYCLPGIAAQLRPPEAWLVFFDENTPTMFRQRVEDCRRHVPFTPIYTHLFDATGWRRAIEAHVRPTRWLLTTRLDNDDSLAADFFSRLHTAAEGWLGANPAAKGPVVFNVPRGLVLANGRLYSHIHPSNAFASLLESWEGARTIMCHNHMLLSEIAPIIQVGGGPGWIQIVHDRNVSNRTRGWRIGVRRLGADFAEPIAADVQKAGVLARAAENVTLGLVRNGLDIVLRRVKR